MTITAAIALGGNLPYENLTPEQNITRALQRCRSKGIHVLRVSSIWRTPCFPVGLGPDFANAAAVVEFDGTAQELLAICHEVEAAFGRTRDARWSARTMDVDLLLVGNLVSPDTGTLRRWIETPNEVAEQPAPDVMLLPHPRIQDRAFVLVPLAEVAPDWTHPILGVTVDELKNALPSEEIEAIQRISGQNAPN